MTSGHIWNISPAAPGPGRAEVRVRIADQGNGFDWRNYLEILPQRATVPHGRGIAIARILSFSSLEYQGNDNEVICTKAVNAVN